MSKIEKIKEKYVADAEQMAAKSRYGYFSIPPSHTAAVTDFLGTKRTPSITQPIAKVTEEFTLSPGTYTQEELPPAHSRKTTSRTFPQLSMAPSTKIRENRNASMNWRKAKDGKEKKLTSRQSSTRHCN